MFYRSALLLGRIRGHWFYCEKCFGKSCIYGTMTYSCSSRSNNSRRGHSQRTSSKNVNFRPPPLFLAFSAFRYPLSRTSTYFTPKLPMLLYHHKTLLRQTEQIPNASTITEKAFGITTEKTLLKYLLVVNAMFFKSIAWIAHEQCEAKRQRKQPSSWPLIFASLAFVLTSNICFFSHWSWDSLMLEGAFQIISPLPW